MPATGTIDASNQVLPNLVLSTSEDTYTFSQVTPPGLPQNRGQFSVVLQSTAEWLYSHKAGGPYFLVGPYQPLRLDGVSVAATLYVKAVAATPTLYALMVK